MHDLGVTHWTISANLNRSLSFVLATCMFLAGGTALAATQSPPKARAPITLNLSGPNGNANSSLTLTFDDGGPTPAEISELKSQLESQSLVAQPPQEIMTIPGETGPYAPIACNKSYAWSDPDGIFSFQWPCGSHAAPWGYRILPTIQRMIAGLVNEQGMICVRQRQTHDSASRTRAARGLPVSWNIQSSWPIRCYRLHRHFELRCQGRHRRRTRQDSGVRSPRLEIV